MNADHRTGHDAAAPGRPRHSGVAVPIPSPIRSWGSVVSTCGDVARVRGVDAGVGDRCEFRGDDGPPHHGEVIAVDRGELVVLLDGGASGIGRWTRVGRDDTPLGIVVGDVLLGRVIDPYGRAIDGRAMPQAQALARRPFRGAAPPPMARQRIERPFMTGIRCIDGALTLGEGQRIGVFAPAGVGKTTLMGMLARHATSDVNVVALIGERGREVREFVEDALGPAGLARTVVVCATAEASALERHRAAHAATALAEHFRDLGRSVLLMVDSLTRFARAHREIGLARGELPTRRGFPASLFAALPALLERAGPGGTGQGSITAVYTVLLESDDGDDPVGEEAKSLLDGHLMLSPELAMRGRFPAIDVLRSVSRLATAIAPPGCLDDAARLRRLLAKHQDIEPLVQMGEYVPGQDPLGDEALARIESIHTWLAQSAHEPSNWDDSLAGLAGAVR